MVHHHDSTQIDWEQRGVFLEQGAEQQLPLYEQAMAWIRELAPASGVRRVLDIGSGPGVITGLLAGTFPAAEVVAVDAAPALLDRVRDRATAAGTAGRISTLRAELPEDMGKLGEADVVWAGDSVHHLGDQTAALAGFGRLLRPGGVLALVEGGLPSRHLPRDIGLGRPGLEARLDVARAEWFARMRAELPGSKEETEDWQALLARAGLRPSGARTFLLDLPAPLPRAAREQLVRAFGWYGDGPKAELLAADDREVLGRLLDPDAAEGLLKRQDAFLLMARTVQTARRD